MRTCLSVTGLTILAVVALLAQSPISQRGGTVRGEISSSGALPPTLMIEMDGNGAGPLQSIMVRGDGSFEIPNASQGVHELRVVTLTGGVLYSQQVVIQGGHQYLPIRIDAPSANRSTSGGNTVSIQQLSHKVPAAAQSAFNKGERAATKGNYREATEAFRQAVAIDPEFADALNELGAAEAELGDLQQAAIDFQKAIDLAPEHRFALPNLSIVLAKQRRYKEAGEVARRALKIVPGACKIHYILAASLIEQKGSVDEALDHLSRASAEVPSAYLVAADLLVQLNRRDDAIQKLQAYLRGAKPDDAYRARAEARLAELQH